MSVDRSKLDFYSGDQIDQILAVFSGSFSATSRPAAQTVGASNNTGISDFSFAQGTFTVDGGSPQDMGSETLVNGETVQALFGSQSGVLNIYYNNADTVAHTIAYNIALLSKPSNTLFTLPGTPNNKLYFDSRKNYQKIALQDSQSVTVVAAVGTTPTDTVVTIPHNLGYRPCVRAFLDNSVTLVDLLVRNSMPLIFNTNVLMTNTVDNANVTFRFTNSDTTAYTLKLHYRIYYDAN